MSLRSKNPNSVSGATYVIILAGVCAALHVGKLSPALPALKEVLSISLIQAGFLLSMIQFAGMTSGLMFGLMVDGLGFKQCMMTGLIILFIASGFGGLVTQVMSLLFLRMMEGVGFLLVTLSAPGMIRHLVPPDRLNKMMGFWGAYMPMGTAMALLVGPYVIEYQGWQIWWWVLSGLTLVIGVLVMWSTRSVVFSYPKKSHSNMVDQIIESEKFSWKTRTRQTLSTTESWLLALCFFMYSGQWLAVIGFLPVIYAQAGYEVGLTAVLTAIVAAANMIGNMVSGFLLNRKFRPSGLLYTGFIVMALGSAIAFANLAWLHESEAEAIVRYSGIVLFSMVGGLIPGTLFAVAVQITAGKPVLSTTVGWMQQWSAFGQFSGPPLVAWVASFAGGWHWTWTVTGACSLTGLILAKQISKRVVA